MENKCNCGTKPVTRETIDPKVLAGMIDISAVQAQNTEDDVRKIAAMAKKYGCICAFALPGLTPLLRDELEENGGRKVKLGGVAGFPSGGDTSETKAFQAAQLVKLGCDEIDMVMNVGKMRSGDSDYVVRDVATVKKAIGAVPLKVILECHHLTPDQIAEAARLAVAGGAAWVKTGTGWAPTGATLENVRIMKEAVGNTARVKAAGGVRTLDTICQMINLGVERFGIGSGTVGKIFEELEALHPGADR